MLSVIIPYTKGGELRENNLATLLKNIKTQTYKDYELIIVEQVFNTSSKDFNCKHIRISYDKDNRFNKSWAINVGVRNSKYDNLLVVDADMLFGNDYFQKISAFSKKHNKFFMGYSKLHCNIGKDNPEERIHDQTYLKAAGGVWYVNKDFFWSIGGMNETYFGYGAEDNDLWQRANNRLHCIFGLDYEVTHMYHDWHPENSHFPLNKERVEKFNIAMSDLDGTIEKLKKLKLGGDKPQKAY